MDLVIQFRGTVYENGYGQVAKKVMRDKRLHAYAKAIYSYLCSFAGGGLEDDRYAFPSVALIRDELGLSKDAFYKYRKQLEETGYLTIEQQKDSKGKFVRNLYIIESVPCPSKQDTDNPCPASRDTATRDTVRQDTNNNNLLNKKRFNNEPNLKHFPFYNWLKN